MPYNIGSVPIFGVTTGASFQLGVIGCNPGASVTLNPNAPTSGPASAQLNADNSGAASAPFTITTDGHYYATATCGSQTTKAELNSAVPVNTGSPTPTQPAPPPPLCAAVGKDGQCTQVDTAIGPIKTDGAEIIYSVFSVILSLSGGILILTIIYAGYLFLASRGDPEKVQKAREAITSAIVGFLFIVFSYAIFGVITADILHLPGFSTYSVPHNCNPSDPGCVNP
jgi:hypothetical protein